MYVPWITFHQKMLAAILIVRALRDNVLLVET